MLKENRIVARSMDVLLMADFVNLGAHVLLLETDELLVNSKDIVC